MRFIQPALTNHADHSICNNYDLMIFCPQCYNRHETMYAQNGTGLNMKMEEYLMFVRSNHFHDVLLYNDFDIYNRLEGG